MMKNIYRYKQRDHNLPRLLNSRTKGKGDSMINAANNDTTITQPSPSLSYTQPHDSTSVMELCYIWLYIIPKS